MWVKLSPRMRVVAGRSCRSICSIDSLSSVRLSRSISTCSLSIRPGASSVCSEGELRLLRGGDSLQEYSKDLSIAFALAMRPLMGHQTADRA
jgi:hypothetical protein